MTTDFQAHPDRRSGIDDMSDGGRCCNLGVAPSFLEHGEAMFKVENPDCGRLAEEVMPDDSIVYGLDLFAPGEQDCADGFLRVRCVSKADATELLEALVKSGVVTQLAPSVRRPHR